jgi:mRNA interferase RelE/StbE
VSGGLADDPCELRTTSTVRRALSETLPESVAAAAYEFIKGLCLPIPTGSAKG